MSDFKLKKQRTNLKAYDINALYGIPHDKAAQHLALFQHESLRDLWEKKNGHWKDALESLPEDKMALLNHDGIKILVMAHILTPDHLFSIDDSNCEVFQSEVIVKDLLGAREDTTFIRRQVTHKDFGDSRLNFALNYAHHIPLETTYPVQHFDDFNPRAIISELLQMKNEQLYLFRDRVASPYYAVELIHQGVPLGEVFSMDEKSIKQKFECHLGRSGGDCYIPPSL